MEMDFCLEDLNRRHFGSVLYIENRVNTKVLKIAMAFQIAIRYYSMVHINRVKYLRHFETGLYII